MRRPSAVRGLSARLLVLTVLFLLLAEFLILTPSISRFRKVYLEQRVSDAHLASLALEATPDNLVSKELEMELLAHAGAYGIVLRKPGRKILMLSTKMPPSVDLTIDLGRGSFLIWIGDAFQALAQNENRILRLIGMAPKDAGVGVEVILDEAPMRRAMFVYSGRILQLSIVISLITAGLLYVSLQWLLVGPMRRLTRSMTEFRENQEDETRTIRPSGRDDEIGVAERELAAMQKDVRAALRQKTGLATLGAAVAKINHDLRNSLATAMLVSDKLADIDDPEVKKVTPRLFEAMDRAVDLCSQTLNYVSDGVPPMEPAFSTSTSWWPRWARRSAPGRRPDDEGSAVEWRNEVAFELDVWRGGPGAALPGAEQLRPERPPGRRQSVCGSAPGWRTGASTSSTSPTTVRGFRTRPGAGFSSPSPDRPGTAAPASAWSSPGTSCAPTVATSN